MVNKNFGEILREKMDSIYSGNYGFCLQKPIDLGHWSLCMMIPELLAQKVYERTRANQIEAIMEEEGLVSTQP